VTDYAAATSISLPMYPADGAEQDQVIGDAQASVGRHAVAAAESDGERALRLGLAGLGSMGRNHLRVISSHPDTILAAVADPTAEVLEAASRRPGPGFADPLVMIATAELDGVVVAAPTNNHSALALAPSSGPAGPGREAARRHRR